jgi:spore coat polysaccharide biosynthesis protein SpsF (cytidylyltransferase family)
MRYEKVVAIVLARVDNAGLPGKVLLPIGAASVLEHVVARVQRMQRIDGFLVATTTAPADDAIEELARQRGWACYRGAADDVLERCVRAAQGCGADHVVLVDGDCPLLSWQEADRSIDLHQRCAAQLTHNLAARGSRMPRGGGCEVLEVGALLTAHTEANDELERRRPTEFLHRRAARAARTRTSGGVSVGRRPRGPRAAALGAAFGRRGRVRCARTCAATPGATTARKSFQLLDSCEPGFLRGIRRPGAQHRVASAPSFAACARLRVVGSEIRTRQVVPKDFWREERRRLEDTLRSEQALRRAGPPTPRRAVPTRSVSWPKTPRARPARERAAEASLRMLSELGAT